MIDEGSLDEWLKRLVEQTAHIERCAEILRDRPTGKDVQKAHSFLRNEWSHGGQSGWRSIIKEIHKRLDTETEEYRAEVEGKIRASEICVRKAVELTGEIFPGNSCSAFVISCNEQTGVLRMRLLTRQGREYEYPFEFPPRDKNAKRWGIIRGLVEANGDGYLHNSSTPITSLFQASSPYGEFAKYIHPVNGRGRYGTSVFVLKQFPKD